MKLSEVGEVNDSVKANKIRRIAVWPGCVLKAAQEFYVVIQIDDEIAGKVTVTMATYAESVEIKKVATSIGNENDVSLLGVGRNETSNILRIPARPYTNNDSVYAK